ncbi:MAG: patatin-like phospholipase family protein [Proteobacteria bacterium]|nr:patatin-like phospholipase family protein [Pseudomonadota bacterium]
MEDTASTPAAPAPPRADAQDRIEARRRTLLDAAAQQRRQALELPEQGGLWGLALSGGGIRSATFCLGLLTALARQRLLLRFDLLSTVSGGGYIGAMLGALFSRAANADDARRVEAALGDSKAHGFAWWLRANGRYLIPTGGRDLLHAGSLYLRNWLGVHVELGLVAVLAGLLLAAFDAGLWWLLHQAGYWVATDPQAPGGFFTAMRWLPTWWAAPWVLLPLTLFIAATWGAAYWALQAMARISLAVFVVVLVVLVAASGGYLAWAMQPDPGMEAASRYLVWAAVGVQGLILALALVLARHTINRPVDGKPAATVGDSLRMGIARNRVTRKLAFWIRASALLLGLGLLDRLAWFWAFEARQLLSLGVGLTLAVAALRAALPLVRDMRPGRMGMGLLLTLAHFAGYALLALVASGWIALVYRVVFSALWLEPDASGAATALAPWASTATWLLLFVPVVTYLLLTGRNVDFLNRSSLHGFYTARLVRSYLGAGNPYRYRDPADPSPIDPLGALAPTADAQGAMASSRPSIHEVTKGDDRPWAEYRPQAHGGPIHLVNVCINQTLDPRGRIFNRDRRGLPLVVASTGHTRVAQEDWAPLPPADHEQPTVGGWTAISGAAVAPGLGNLTRGGVAVLTMLAGLRLGYWWQREAERRCGLLAKSRAMWSELTAQFGGAATERWFLTDGGHFENTGAYPLLAQRANLIVVADCGADPDYQFGDLENLARKARIDLRTELIFQRPTDRAALPGFGSLSDLASATSDASLALARIRYPGDATPSGLMVIVKPSLNAGLAIDILNYHDANPTFPQQTTADQFFSEAQWESYHQLGLALGSLLSGPLLERLLANPMAYMEADHGAVATALAAAAAAPTAPPPSVRLPGWLNGRTVVKSTLGLGAVVTTGVAVWQGLDAWRNTGTQAATQQRAALKELATLWAALPGGAPERGRLAAALVHTADTLCPGGEASWFTDSPLAGRIVAEAWQACTDLPAAERPASCEALREVGIPRAAHDGQIPTCLSLAPDLRPAQRLRQSPYQYGIHRYTEAAPYWLRHPCDPGRALTEYAEDQYETKSAPLYQRDSPRPDLTAQRWPAAGCTLAVTHQPQQPQPLPEPPAQPAPPPQALPTPLPMPMPVPMPAPPPPVGGTAAPAPVPAALPCSGRTIYVQIYSEGQRKQALAWAATWQKLGATVPAVENVVRTARDIGRPPPEPIAASTVRHHDPAGLACAQTLAKPQGWRVEPLSPRLKPSPGVIEVWLAPGRPPQ